MFGTRFMNLPHASALKPRKTPQQARSVATVEAIHTATIQVLRLEGIGRLTTARVAERAGVSIGTLYQYYPNKQALLLATVEKQLASVAGFMLEATNRIRGKDLATVAEGLANAWLDAKTSDLEAFRTVYDLAAAFDMEQRMGQVLEQMTAVFADLIAAAPDAHFADNVPVAFMLATVIGGSVRLVLDTGASEINIARLRQELPQACRAYLVGCR